MYGICTTQLIPPKKMAILHFIRAGKADQVKSSTAAAYLQVPLTGTIGNGNASPMSSYTTEPSGGGFRMSSPGNSSILSRWSHNFPIKFK